MKKQLLALAATALMAAQSATVGAQNVVYYSQDFQGDTKPAELLYYDGDGNELTDNLVGTGLECGTWHLIRLTAGDPNKLMGSASAFTTPGKANDWMVTPQIKIYGAGAKLTWKAMAASKIKKDGYKIYVSTKGYAMEDFEQEPIFSTEAEEGGELQSREVSLDKYAGQNIYIAFVNDSYDKYVICIDDIQVSGPAATEAHDRASFEVTTPLMTDTGKAQMSVNVKNLKAPVLDAVKVCYRVDNQVFSQDFTGLNLNQGQTAALTVEKSVDVPLNTTCTYDIWVEVDGDPALSVRDSIRGTYFVSNRRTLIEEGTGTWCGNCPDGMTALAYLEDNYPDNVVTIAVHADTYLDPMYYPEYVNFCMFPAYPTIMADRKYLGQPLALDEEYNYSFSVPGYGIEYFFLLAQKQYAVAELNGTATLTDADMNRLEINVESRFVNDIKNSGYDIALILLEDSVTAPDGTLYAQNNERAKTNFTYYGLKDTIYNSGGWGSLPGTVRMKYDHVARAAYNGSFNGAGNNSQLPSVIEGGKVYTSKFTWDIPEGTVNNMQYASIIALMTDATGYIVNCCKMHVTDPKAIDRIETTANATITAIYTPNGTRVEKLQKGINIVEYTDKQGNTFTRKMVK